MACFFKPLASSITFLTRLTLPITTSEADWQKSLWFFFPVGLVLGIVLAACSWLCNLYLNSQLAAWIWISLEVWLSRALHWDGVGDLADALGSGKKDSKFWEILHDSRIGSFGALGLMLCLLGTFLTVEQHISQHDWLFLILAPAYGRCAPLWLATLSPTHGTSKLGAMVSNALREDLNLKMLYQALFFIPLIFFFTSNKPGLLLLLLTQYLLHTFFLRTAKQHNGLSGDFFGAAIEYTQLNFLLLSL